MFSLDKTINAKNCLILFCQALNVEQGFFQMISTLIHLQNSLGMPKKLLNEIYLPERVIERTVI